MIFAMNNATYTFNNTEFSPEHFEVLEFYDQRYLLAWQGDKIALCVYKNLNDIGNPRLIESPAPVKRVQSFRGRIFVTCDPSGVYKLSRKCLFALLSNSAIGIGCEFYQVIRVVEEYLEFYDKQNETRRMCIKYDPINKPPTSVLGLSTEKTDRLLLTALREGASDIDDICILCSSYEIYKISANAVKILYSYIYPIVDMVEITQNEKTKYLMYLTDKNVIILMYEMNSEIIFETMRMNQTIRTACALVDEIAGNTIWIIHSDGNKTYKSCKVLGKRSIRSTELNIRNITCLRCYDSEVLGLTSRGKLLDLKPLMPENVANTEEDDFIKLKAEMLDGTDSIVNAICDKVKELQTVDKQLLNEQNALKRINMFACKQKITTEPKFWVQKISSKSFVCCDLGYGMPEKCQMTFAIESGGCKIFSSKRIAATEMSHIGLTLPDCIFTKDLNVVTDLVTVAEDGYSWCLIKDCMKNDDDQKEKVQNHADNKRNDFVTAKLAVLRNLKKEDTLDIDKLNAIKNSMRKEFGID